MPSRSFARHELDGAGDEVIAPEALPPALPGSPRKLSRRHSLLNSLRNRWRKPQDQVESIPQFVLDNEYIIEEEKRLSLGRRSSNPELVAKGPRRVIPSLPRPQTFHRQESEKRERLLEVPSTDWERRAASAERKRGWSVGGYRRPRSPKSFPFPHISAPLVAVDVGKGIRDEGKLTNGNGALSGEQDASDGDHDQQASHDANEAMIHYDSMQDDDCNEDDEDQAELHREFERRWILNLSMSFRDKSQREKFFVTYAETPTKWRRLTVSLDYRSASEGSLEADLKSLHYQRDKSFRIYEAIRESLGDIQYYDTVTNLKLETTEDDGQLHVHVREDANEIVQWPAASLMDHIECPRYTESEVEFESHLSGFVYKVQVDGRLLIKKEIPGPDTVDEFLYEVNALDALYGEDHVVQLQGLITDDYGGIVKGLLISYASRGALVDMLYDYSGELSWHRREKWAYQIVQGLSAIHEAGFVQGDFTLSNIVIDDDDNAQIIDINRRGCPVGWESPELGKLIDSGQRIGMHISVKTDLYQLGMVLWALAEQVDEPERSRPLPPLRREVPGYLRFIVDTCLHERPQQRANACQLLRSFPRDAGRPPTERPSVDFRISPTRTGDLKTSDPSLTTSHRSDKEYIDPKMAVTIDEVQRQRRMDHGSSAFITDQVTYVEPMDSNPASTSYHFESSGSWIVGHSRGRSPVSSRRRRSSPCDRASTSATSLSCSPDHGSRRSAKVYLNDEDDEKECYPANISESDLEPSPHTRPRSPSPVLVDKRLAEVRDQNQSTASFAPPLHQDSGFDESMLEDMHLEDTIVPSDLMLHGDPRIDPGTPTRFEDSAKHGEGMLPHRGASLDRQELPKREEAIASA